MSLTEEKHLFAMCYVHTFIALMQLSLVILASAFHNDVKPTLDKTTAYKSYLAATRTIGGLALLLIIIQAYISIVFTLIEGPKIVIIWLVIAQLAVTAYYFYLPFEYLRKDGKHEKDEWFMVDEKNLEDLEQGAVFEKKDSTSQNEPNRVADYGTVEFVQLSGPGAAHPA
ncbi:hypothetical protein IL306_013885 [Fusarium sp. DS 682]|nr:hypothetical protein IL306_013885 [Fusarium sp. DS 682]